MEVPGARIPPDVLAHIEPLISNSRIDSHRTYCVLQNSDNSPFDGLIGTLRTYFVDEDFSNPHVQIIIYGIFPDNSFYDLCQIKFIPVARKADLPPGLPIEFESLEELNAGFAALNAFLEPRDPSGPRRAKTARRRAAIAGSRGGRGGGRRRSGTRRRAT